MLNELSELQNSDEGYWMTSMSFSVETRDGEGDEIVHRRYTFTWGEEFDEWHFSEYEEKRCNEAAHVDERNWKTSRHVWWHEPEDIDVEVPQIVSNKLAERLGVDNIVFQL